MCREGDAVVVSVISLHRAATSGWEKPGEEREQGGGNYWDFVSGFGCEVFGGREELEGSSPGSVAAWGIWSLCLWRHRPSRNRAPPMRSICLPETPWDDEFIAKRSLEGEESRELTCPGGPGAVRGCPGR